MFIVDGVEQIATASLSDINPNDIENIEVVKGAAAASLYGSRAGYGVISVTTKSGKATGEGVRDLMNEVWRTIESVPRPAIATPDPASIVLRADEPFEVNIEDGVFVVSGPRIERLAAMTDFDSDEAFARFEHVLNAMGVEKRLRELGVHDGATVRIAGNEFLYS